MTTSHKTLRFIIALLGMLIASLMGLTSSSLFAASYTFTTFAGTPWNPGSTNGTGEMASFNGPMGVAVDGSSNVYVADLGNNDIRKITSAGVVTTLAGLAGASGSINGTGGAARFNQPTGVTVDGSGNVYVADDGNEVIRKITSAGVVTTLAGTVGVYGSLDGTGSSAQFDGPYSLGIDSSGNLYVSDFYNETIRQISPSGVVVTIGGSVGNSGILDGIGSGAEFNGPTGVAVDASGNVYVADDGNDTIRRGTASASQSQSITFPSVGTVSSNQSVTLAAFAGYNLAITYTVISGPGVINGNMLTFTKGGTVVIQASQGGNSLFAATSVTQTITVLQAQTITFLTVSPGTVGQSQTLAGSASSGLTE